MVDVEELEFAMVDVRYPHMRLATMEALARLADVDYQRRVWVEKAVPSPRYYDELALELDELFDRLEVLPDPVAKVGEILLEGDELKYLRVLGELLARLVDEVGPRPDSDYVSHPDWGHVLEVAGLALAAMVRAGGISVGS